MELKPLERFLFGEFELTIDDKNRLLIPSDVRKRIDAEQDGQAFFVIVGGNRKLWFYPERAYEKLISQAPNEISPGEDRLAFDQLNFALASRLEWDKQGRVLVPDKQLQRTGLSKDVTMIGARDHLELWNRAEWDARREELWARNPRFK